MAHAFLSKFGDYWQRLTSHFFIIRSSEDGEVLVSAAGTTGSSGENEDVDDTPVIIPESRPRRIWTRQLIFSNLAIVVGTSFMSGFYLMAIAKPYGLYPNDYGGQQTSQIPQRKAAALPLATLFFHHLLTYYASRLLAYIGFASFLGTKFGRRLTLMSGAVVGFFAVIIGLISQLCSIDTRDVLWAISTGCLGLQNGVGQVIAPAYLIELAPVQIRGACGCFYETFFWAGVAFAFIAEIDLPGSELTLWTFILGLLAGFYLLQFGMLWFGFESPHWLVHEAGRDQDALFVIKHLRQCDSENAFIELNEIKAMASSGNDNEPGCCFCPNSRRFACEICKAKVVWPTFIAACLLSANLLTGAPIIYKIQTALLNKSDLTGDVADAYHFPLVLGVSLILLYLGIMSVTGFFLVDTIGRRKLITVGMAFMTLAYIPTVLGTFYKDAAAWQVGTVLFMAAFSLGPGPIAAFMPAELFDHRSRLTATSIAHFVTQLFPVYLAEVYDIQAPYPQLFMPGGIIFCVLEFTLLWLFLPETKQMPFDRIVAKFQPEENWLQVISREQQQNNVRRPMVTPSLSAVAPFEPAAIINIHMTETTQIRSCPAAAVSNLDDGDINEI